MKPKRRADLVIQEMDTEMVILDRHNGMIHQLNGTARDIWQLCDGTQTEDEIVQHLVQNYAIDLSEARSDVATAIEKLENLNLLS